MVGRASALPTMGTMRIFIGYDSRQPLAYTVCRSSIERYAKERVQIEPLRLDWLPITRKGLTDFTYTRYLVPWLCNYQGYALFMDGDMIARENILDMFEGNVASVSVVKGARRFEWPSLMWFNNAKCDQLTPEYLNDEVSKPQSFEWAYKVGELPAEWNHCVGYDKPNPTAKIIHFTAGIPHFPETKDCEHADAWREELAYATSSVNWETLMGKSVHRDIVKPATPEPVLRPFTIKSVCAANDEQLYANISHALTLGLPVLPQAAPHSNVAVLVASGPSVKEQLPAIRAERDKGRQIIAVKGAHDWLISQGIVPDYAVCVDPGEEQWKYFSLKHPHVKYVMASQCHPSMFAHLRGHDVSLWHAYIRKGQSIPPHGTPLIGGGTTTGLRALTLWYSMGYREFELYGYDSCVTGDTVRIGRNLAVENETKMNEVVVGGKTFHCTPALTVQASEFQNLYSFMPDAEFRGHGDGLIQTIIDTRTHRPLRTTSFLHHGGPTMASYRYRCAMPAAELGCAVNELHADVLIVSKPEALTIVEMKRALGKGQSVIVDFCDDHFDNPHYQDMLRLADAVTCSTDVLAKIIYERFRMPATVIPEPYEFPEAEPHCNGDNLMWFGNGINRPTWPTSFDKFRPVLMVSNSPLDLAWSHRTMLDELRFNDIVLMPRTANYKSANRTVEAIRQGCFVVAEPHPALMDIPGLWIGDMEEGIQWASSHKQEANERIRQSQIYVLEKYAPKIVASAWSQVIRECPSTWGQDIAPGPIGSMSISKEPTLTVT